MNQENRFTNAISRKNTVFFSISILISLLSLAACSNNEKDINYELKSSVIGINGRVEPLPVYKPYSAFEYVLEATDDPFGPAKAQIAVKSNGSSGLDKPDMLRVRQPMEAFSIESLELNGSIIKNGVAHALIAVKDNLYTIKAGDYVGQNFGRVVKISDSEVVLIEKIQESSGDWVDRPNRIGLSSGIK